MKEKQRILAGVGGHVMKWTALYISSITAVAGCAHVQSHVVSGVIPIETSESVPKPGIHVTTRTVQYAVHGRTVHELRDEMSRIGPIDDRRHQYAYTWGTYAWTYPYERTQSGCGTGPVKVELEIVQTFPAWVSREVAARETVTEWDRWMAATKAHEDGHLEILKSILTQIPERLEALAPRSNCDELERFAGTLGNSLLEEMRARHVAYDKETQHGKRTGAYLREDLL